MVPKHVGGVIFSIAAVMALGIGYRATEKHVTLIVDGSPQTVATHRQTVADLLRDVGLSPDPRSSVSPPAASLLHDGETITVDRAIPLRVVSGEERIIQTRARTVRDALEEAGVRLNPRDLVILDGVVVHPETALRPSPPQVARGLNIMAPPAPISGAGLRISPHSSRGEPSPTQAMASIVVRRAVPVIIQDQGIPLSILTPAPTVGDALFWEGITVYAADRVTPPLGTPLQAAMRIIIERARPVSVTADGRRITTRTMAATVRQLLAEVGVTLGPLDYTEPEGETPLTSDLAVRVIRVNEQIITESEAIPFKTVWQPDPNMDIDQRRVVQAGKNGTRKRQIRIIYENGQEVKRVLDREWIDVEPTTQVIAYGTRIALHTVDTPDGPIQVWRTLRVYATYYTPASSGKPKGHPAYGITRTGIWATKGVIAVDPEVIRLHTKMYVPGYGFGAAEDTGGGIKGMHIDLAFDDDDPNPKHLGWVTIYLLPPVPPASEIPWILPDYPRERR